MAYRNKTFVSFASEDISYYRLMTAWKANRGIDFDFYDAHDLNNALDTSLPDTIRRRLRERLANTKQVVMLVSDVLKPKSELPKSFIYYEVRVIADLALPVTFANLNGSRESQSSKLPYALKAQYSMSVPFGPKIIQYALDNFPSAYAENRRLANPKTGPYYYKDSVYRELGL